jgi:hypothetical protein
MGAERGGVDPVAREPGHDSYWRLHRDAFLLLVPSPGDGLRMTFTTRHWTLEHYAATLTGAGFVLDAVREVRDATHVRWSRYPLFLHVRGIRTQAAPLRSSSVLRPERLPRFGPTA